ncbi:hypothetical protein [Heyndrickxia coagulans]|uniref:hypothetical protein n=1 Tax=Heyndrickxia coagulans TaxID=1398 RepID=UPI0002F70DA6|nr:hypothetical protein [Heyndrickxia coagulans]
MELKKTYSTLSHMYLCQTVILACGLSAFCLALMYIGRGGMFIWLVLAVWLFILYFAARYFYYQKIEENISGDKGEEERRADSGQYLIQFPPGAKLSVQLYDGSGRLGWMLEEKAFRQQIRYFRLERGAGATFCATVRKRQNWEISIRFPAYELAFSLKEAKGKEMIFENGSRTCAIRKNGNRDLEFYRDEQLLAVVSRGMMPVSWQEKFPLNAPVLDFTRGTEEDEVLVIALLAFFYRHDKYFV